MGSVDTSYFRPPTSKESESVVEFMLREYYRYSGPALLCSGLLWILGFVIFIRALSRQDISDFVFAGVLSIPVCGIGCILLRQCRKLRERFMAVYSGPFEVLDCHVERVLDLRKGMVAVRADSGGTRWEWLALDAEAIRCFQKGEDPALLLVRYSGDQLVLLSGYQLSL